MPPQVLTSEGTIRIPVEIQKQIGIKAGDSVDFVVNERGEAVLKPGPVPRPKTRSIMDLIGILKWDGPPVTIEEINKTIDEGWASGFKEDGASQE